MEHKIKIYIKEKSFVARLAALKLNSQNVAIVFGHTIYLYGVSKADFLNHPTWLRHEVQHVLQWHKYGYIKFVLKYVWLSVRFGYKNNPFEIEARLSENDKELLKRVSIA